MDQWSLPAQNAPDPLLRPADLPPRDQRRARLWRWGTIGLIAAMVVVPVAVKQFPREIALWVAATAIEARLNGETGAAMQGLDRALTWDPRNARLYLQRAVWNREDGKFDAALDDCERAIELAPWNPMGYFQRSEVLQHLRRHDEALADWKKIAELNAQQRDMSDVSVWNGLAYARAIADQEIEAGLEDIQRAVKRQPDSPEILDTQGYLRYRAGQFTEAIRDLDEAVAMMEIALKRKEDTLGKVPSPVVDLREAEYERKRMSLVLAVVLYHRSLVLDKMDQSAAAAADRDRVRQLGFDPLAELF